MNIKPHFAVSVLFCFGFLLFLPALWSQEFTTIDRDLDRLENLIADTLRNTEEQQKLLEDLQKNLSESGNLIENYSSIIDGQERLLADLQVRLNEMSETYRRQSALLAKSEKNQGFGGFLL
jgi:paraquat-inducible protein B